MSTPEQVCANGNGVEHVELLLPATNDDHGGIVVEMEEAMDSEVFVTLLRASISEWRRQVVISCIQIDEVVAFPDKWSEALKVCSINGVNFNK